jgi:hypothetical protein
MVYRSPRSLGPWQPQIIHPFLFVRELLFPKHKLNMNNEEFVMIKKQHISLTRMIVLYLLEAHHGAVFLKIISTFKKNNCLF